MVKLRRPLSQYAGCTPNGVASGSKAQMMYFVEDAKADIGKLANANADLLDALQQCQRALLTIVGPDAIRQTTVITAYAQATAAEARARTVIAAQVEA